MFIAALPGALRPQGLRLGAALAAAQRSQLRCGGCEQMKRPADFSSKQLRRGDARKCKGCTDAPPSSSKAPAAPGLAAAAASPAAKAPAAPPALAAASSSGPAPLWWWRRHPRLGLLAIVGALLAALAAVAARLFFAIPAFAGPADWTMDELEAVRFYESAARKGGDAAARAGLRRLALAGVAPAAPALRRLGLALPEGAESAIVGLGGCPLGDVAEQEAAMNKWGVRPLEAIRKAAEAGDLAAMYAYGQSFYLGARGAQESAQQARIWYERAAAGNVALAQSSLGYMFHKGEAGPVDLGEAARYYLLAAEQGYSGAQHNIGSMLRDGVGVPLDLAAAARWFRLAAEQGHSDAQAALAKAYTMGEGVAVDRAAALAWARRSAALGNMFGEANLGALYEFGWGPRADPHEAARLYERAAIKGEAKAREGLRRLAAQGVKEAVAAAGRLAL